MMWATSAEIKNSTWPCTFSPASITILDSNGASSTLNIATTGPSLAKGAFGRGRFFYAFSVPFFALILFGVRSSSKTPGSGRIVKSFLTALVMMGALIQASCGGGNGGGSHGGGGGTPPGNYTITVTGTAGATQHSMTVNLTVQ